MARAAAALVILFASAVEAAPGLAVWSEGRDSAKLTAAVAAAVPAEWTVTASRVVAKAARGLKAKKQPARSAELAGRLKVEAVLYARSEARGRRVVLVLVKPGAEPVERRSAVGAVALKAAVGELLKNVNVNVNANVNPNANANVNVNANANVPVKTVPRKIVAPSVAPVATVAVAGPAPVLVARPETPPGTLISVALTGGVGGRRLQYNQPITNNLPSYSVAAVPWMGVKAALFPLARSRVAFLRDVGMFGEFGQSLYQQAAVAGGPRLNATWSTFEAGLRWRYRFRESRRVVPAVGASVAYGRTAYTFDDGGRMVGGTPSVDYRYLRPAIGGRVSVGPVTLFVDAGYRGVLSAGYVGSHFPRASIGGADVGAGFAFSLPRHFELGLSGQYLRYFYDARPQPGDPFIAGGAVDEFAVGELMLAYVY